MSQFDFSVLARANPAVLNCNASIRNQTEHFQVDEQLPFEPEGQGGHVMLRIQKTHTNTDWLAKQLACFANVAEVAVGFAGMKDRHAVTTQWFTVNMEGMEEPDWYQFDSENWQIKQLTRHNKKLKRGVLSGNHFKITLADLQGEQQQWQQNLQRIQQQGVPNYFAEQRFGHNHANLERADAWFQGAKAPKKRQQRSIYLSAARSWLFNLVLSKRIEKGNWNQIISGDVMQLAGTHSSFFVADEQDEDLVERLQTFDIHPTGPLWGRGEALTKLSSLKLEQQVLEAWSSWQQGLEKAGLKQERRALRLYPEQLTWQFTDTTLELAFYLPAGSYATAVLRELAQITDASQRNSVSAPPFSVVGALRED
ncbi:tRNA pseudouridine(13) synthase TruD [Methylophaga sp. OBS4]|uniref:tRNA pseudouridine(13) synthase TruD n=1 Tax=Methylophaga sp. OBS4 TaxID=2991935 RepID=UPI002259DBAF|nr:tRNA pseudouridine(13) synthase TruD [Methylophaga sp. OBS4]MCX4187805.1 tRNA pseudouridine(13) synthase TruD [Methylophaga sp. OBS4]